MLNFSIPANLAVGAGALNGRINVTFITEMRTSKRAKNGLFTIPNEKSFKKKIKDGNITRLKNEYKDGYHLIIKSKYRSTGGYAYIFLLGHDDLKDPTEISFDNYQAIIKNTTISNGTIVNKLIYTTLGFMTEEGVTEVQETHNKIQMDNKKLEETRSESRVYKKDLINGQVYVTYTDGDKIPKFLIYYGCLETKKGSYHKYYFVPAYYMNDFKNAIRSEKMDIFIFNKMASIHNLSRSDSRFQYSILIKGMRYIMNSYTHLTRLTLPKLWEAPKGDLENINIYDLMSTSGIQNFGELLNGDWPFAKKNRLQKQDFYGINGLSEYIKTREENGLSGDCK
jgi:hypothetical protein